MKAAVFNPKLSAPEIIETPVPEIDEDEILLKPMAVGVCGSEIQFDNLKGPGSFGHEPAGIVAKAGRKVKNVKEGDRVFVHHRVPCLVCHYCRRGNHTLCSDYKEYGFDPSAYAEYTRVKSRNVKIDTIILPDHITFEEGSLIEPLATVWRACKRSNIHPGDTVLIIGAGFAGLAGVQIARIFGAATVIISDIVDFKLDLARKLGADYTINPRNENISDKLLEINNGRKADVVIVIPSSAAILEDAIRLTEKGGTITQYGVSKIDDTITINPFDFLHFELTYRPSYSSSPIDTKEVAAFLFRGKIKGAPLITHHFKLEQLPAALALKTEAATSIKIIIHPHDS